MAKYQQGARLQFRRLLVDATSSTRFGRKGKAPGVPSDELERSESKVVVGFEIMCEAALSKAELGLGTSNRFESCENNPEFCDWLAFTSSS